MTILSLIHKSAPLWPDFIELYLPSGLLAVKTRINPGARRLWLRFNTANGQFSLTIPPGFRRVEIEQFLSSQQNWMIARRAAHQPLIEFAPGLRIPFAGGDTLLGHDLAARRVKHNQDRLIIPGAREFFHRRTRDYLRAAARRSLSENAHFFALSMGRKIRRISVTDPKTRWGSCSSNARLAFSWRLIMAPPLVLNYVALHEAAHLIELNHGEKFWQLVERHMPDYQTQRRWLKQNGKNLLRYR